MTSKNPEEELAEFLAGLPPWASRSLDTGFPSTGADAVAFAESDLAQSWLKIVAQYESILRRIPARWREHCRKQKDLMSEVAKWASPPNEPGRPRLDTFAKEAAELKLAGKSYAEVARELNRRHGGDTTNPEAIRKLLARRRREPPKRS